MKRLYHFWAISSIIVCSVLMLSGCATVPKEQPKTPVRGSAAQNRNIHRCQICGYDYEPQAGDPDNGVAPGTPWENVPDDWACPQCGAGKDAFDEL